MRKQWRMTRNSETFWEMEIIVNLRDICFGEIQGKETILHGLKA